MITRRRFLQGSAAAAAFGALLTGYGTLIEAGYRLNIRNYRLTPPGWNAQHELRIVALADFHFCRPWMQEARTEEIVAAAMAQQPDVIVLLGDYLTAMRLRTDVVPPPVWAGILGQLRAPLGVHAILGNHDWWNDPDALARRGGPTIAGQALERAGIRVYENDAALLKKDDFSFWLAGLGDQIAFSRDNAWKNRMRPGMADLPAMMRAVGQDHPVIAMVHEPDAFIAMPQRVSLTLAGHTHGGQIRLLGYPVVVPSRYGRRFSYGHIVEENRHLIVSGGLGCSILPVRIGMPPEIVVVDLGNAHAA